MNHSQQSTEYPDYEKHAGLEHTRSQTTSDEQQIYELIDQGFHPREARQLAHFYEQLYTNVEVQQRLADDEYMQFARWLYEQGVLNEEGR